MYFDDMIFLIMFKYMIKKGEFIIKCTLKSIAALFLALSLCSCSTAPVNKKDVKSANSKVSTTVEARTGTAKDTSEANKKTSVKNKKLVVCIDPGHGAYDKGTKSSSGVFEKDVNLKVGLKVGQILEKNNIKVVYTRKDDKTVLGKTEKKDLAKRLQISETNNADIYVSIHCNFYKDPSIQGIELWCNDPKSKSEKLAQDILNGLSQLKYTQSRGVKNKNTSSLYVLKHNKAIAALVEIGYLSNKNDCAFITSDSGQIKCAEAIAKAIINFKSSMN